MGFRENLKAQLQYSDMLVKELSARTGIRKATLDSYLKANGYTPSVDTGVKIADALGVTVEYLVTGHDRDKQKIFGSYRSEARLILMIAEQLNTNDRYKLLEIAKVLKKTADK